MTTPPQPPDPPAPSGVDTWFTHVARQLAALRRDLDGALGRVAALEADQPTPPAPDPPGGRGRITRDGLRLMLGGRPLRIAGVNLEHAVGCGVQPGAQPGDAQADGFFGDLGPEPKAVRIWVMPGISANWKRNYRRIVDAAARHGHYLIVTLFNGQPHCTTNQIRDYPTLLPAWQADWVRVVCGEHAGNQAIMAYECANEVNEGHANIGAWYGAVTALVRQCDPGALVFTGGGHNSNDAAKIAAFVRRSGVDGFSLHDYYKPAGSLSPRAGIFNQAAVDTGVPWYMGERGFSIPVGGGGSTDQEVNARHLAAEYRLYLGGDPKTTNCCGYFYWDARFNQRESTTAWPGEMSGLYRAICGYRRAPA